MTGGQGNDSVAGGDGDDTTEGGSGDDTLAGGLGNDAVDGGEGNDSASGGDGDDTVTGGDANDTGDDTLDGGAGNDLVTGGQGNDSVGGGAGNDDAQGGSGDDTVDGGAGDDTVDGGAGNDSVGGGAGDDTVTGGDANDTGDDTLDGGAGNDSVSGGQGNDSVGGGDGNDDAQGGSGDDTVDGGAGNDTVDGGAGNDSVGGGAGDDTVTGGDANDTGDDTLDGGAGNDSVSGGQGNDSVDGGDGNDTTDGGAGDDTLAGGLGNDVVDGGEGNDSASGGAGDDTVTGGDANDTGADTLDGGAGNDSVSGGQGNDSVDGGDGNDTTEGGSGDDTLTGGAGQDVMRGGDDQDSLDGGSGNDVVDGGAGNDTARGGLGDDTLSGGDANDTGDDLLDGGEGNDSVTGGQGNDTLIGGDANDLGNDTLDGGAGDDSMDGGSGADSLLGGEGQDTVAGGAGADTLDGGDGGDSLDGGTGNDSISGGAGNDTASGGAGDDTLSGGDANDTGDDHLDGGDGNDVVGGGQGQDTLAGGAGNDTLDGGDGADDLDGGAGADSLAGGAGNDTLLGGDANDTSADTLDGGAGNDQVDGGAGADSLTGGTGDDTLLGGLGNDTLVGGGATEAGDDSLDGGAGVDSMSGGAGNDTLVFDAVDALIDGGTGNDTLKVTGASLDLLSLADSVLRNIETIELADPAAQRIQLKVGDVAAMLGGGNTTLTILGDSGDELVFRDGWANAPDVVDNGVTYHVFTNGAYTVRVESDVTTSVFIEGTAAADSLVGASGDDSILGGSGADTLVGNDGADTLGGGGGNDSVLAGSGNDSVTGDDGNDTVLGGDGNDVVSGDAGNDSLQGEAGDDTLLGGLGNDSVSGGIGGDSLEGGTGNDTLDGGDGNDLILGGSASDTVAGGGLTPDHDSIVAGAGDDTVLGGAGNDTVRGGTGNDSVEGGNGNDSVLGEAGDDILAGEAGDDTLSGGDGNDELRGGAGTDSLSGGAGNDLLVGGDTGGTDGNVLDGGDGNDTLTGSGGNDSLVGGAGADSLSGGDGNDTLVYDAADVTISGGAGSDTLVINDAEVDFRALQLAGTLQVSTVEVLNLNGTSGSQVAVNEDAVLAMTASPNHLYVNGDDLDTLNLIGAWAQDATPANQVAGYVCYTSQASDPGATPVRIYIQNQVNLAITQIGNEYDNTLTGRITADIIEGRGGNDSISGGDGSDTLLGGAGNDTLDGGVGIDTAEYSDETGNLTVSLGSPGSSSGGVTGTDTLRNIENITGGQGNDLITGDGSFNLLDGGAGNDTIHAGADADTLVGGSGNDLLLGEDGADKLRGGSGADTLDGGSGNDTADYSDETQSVTVDLSTGTATDGTGAHDTLLNLENIAGGSGNDLLNGNAGANLIAGGTGDDTISGGAGNDTLQGGAGSDTLTYASSSEPVVVNLGSTAVTSGGNSVAASTARTGSEVDSLSGFENVTGGSAGDTLYGGSDANQLSGGAGNDLINGGAGDDTLSGGNDADTLVGGLGNDVLQGGSGRDVADYSANTAATTVDLQAGTASSADSGSDTLSGVEDASGGAGNDTLTGDAGDNQLWGQAGADTLDGGAGNDSLRGGTGNDSLIGGDGIDTAVYDDVSGPLTIDLAAGTVMGGAGATSGSDTLVSIENVIGSGSGDLITGDSGANRLDGAGGADTLDGGAGNDTIVFDANDASVSGGAGVDTLFIDANTSLVDLTVTRDEVFRQFEVIDVTTDGAQIIKLSDADIRALTGDGTGPTGGTLLIRGNPDDSIRLVGANWPTSPTGTETIDGVTYDVYAYNVAGGVTTVKVQQGLSVGFIFRSDESPESTTGTAGSDEYQGNGGNDTFVAGAGDDVGDGGTGDDSLIGGAGNDTLAGGAGNDTLLGGNQPDTAGSGDDSLDAGAGNDLVQAGDGNDTVLGGTGEDTLEAGSGDDSVDGGDGADTVLGGTGNDTLLGGSGNDSLEGGDGGDSVNAGIGDDTVSGGAGNDTLVGGGGVDTLDYRQDTAGVSVNLETGAANGNDAGQDQFSEFENVLGGSGNDTITGSGSANLVDGGAGADQISTGLGNDTIRFDAADTVNAGEGQDVLDINTLTTADLRPLAGVQLTGIEEIDLTGDGVQDLRLDAASVLALSDTTDTVKIHGDAGDLLTLSGNWVAAGTQPVVYGSESAQPYLKYTLLDPTTGRTATVLVDPALELAIEYLGASGNDTLAGGDGNDTVNGGAGNDTLSGGSGGDTLLGGDGNDLLTYDPTDVNLDGGAGTDTLALATTADAVVLDLTAPALPAVDGVRPAISNIEVIDLTGRTSGGTGNNALVVNPAALVDLVGATGVLTVTGNAGDAVYVSGLTEVNPDGLVGYTTWTWTNPDNGNTVTLRVADAVTVQDAIVGTNNGDGLVVGNAQANLVRGLAGDDTVDGAGGADVLRGDTGDDVMVYDPADVLVDGGEGNDTLLVDNESTLNLTTLNDAVLQSIGTIDLVAAGNPVAFTAAGSDILALNGGDPVRVLGDANDSIALQGNWVKGSNDGTATTYTLVDASGQTATLVVANAIPVSITYTGRDTSERDTLVAGAGDQVVDALRGNDSLDGGAGNDTLLGGAGDDTLVWDAADGVVSGGTGSDVLQVKGAGVTLDLTTVANSRITGIEKIDITGSGDNTVVMNPDDVQALSTDSDTIIVQGDAGDSVRLAGEGWEARGSELVAGITYNKFIAYATDGSVVTVLAGLRVVKGDQLVGDPVLADTLVGGSGADLVEGRGGDDSLSGGGGADLLYGGAGNDTVIYDGSDVLLHGGSDGDAAGAQDNDTLKLVGGGQIIDLQEAGRPTAGALQPSLQSFETLDINGNGANYLVLDAATAAALGGNGLVIQGGSDDIVFVDGDPAAQTFTVTGATVRQVITDDGDATSPSDNLTGTTGQDAIKAGTGADTIDGGAGADLIYAGAGDDVVTYDANDLRVFGGTGTDTLVITTVDSADGGSVSTANRTNTAAGDVDLTTAGLGLVDGFEVIDMRGNGNQTVRLDEASVLAMSDTGRMTVKGDLNDVLKLYGNWSTQGIESDADGKMYTVYERNGATVSVAQEVTVSITNELGGSVIMGTSGADDTTVSSFADGASLGDGDDVIRLASLNFVGVDGGRGYDKVYFELNSNATINTALLSRTSLTGIEEIDLRQDSTTSFDDAYTNTLVLTPEKVLEMTDEDGLLVVSGSSKDSINLYGQWTAASNAQTVVYNGVTYMELVADNGARLYYSPEVNVTRIDPTLQMSAFSVAYDDGAYLVASGIEQYTGWRVENAGDVNRDGLQDIVINRVDGAYVVFGTDSMAGQIDLANLGTRGFQITGNGVTIDDLTNTGWQNATFNGYNFGVTGIGDVNGDGIADLATTNGTPNSLTVIYGRAEWDNVSVSGFVPGAANGFTMTFAGFPDERYTTVEAVGDVNGDGYADFAVGNAYGNSAQGEVYLVFGGTHVDNINTTAAQTSRWVRIGSDSANRTNIGVDIAGLGDINGDGFADFVVGGPDFINSVTTGTTTQQDYSGGAYLIYGKAEGWSNTTVVQRDHVDPLLLSTSPVDSATGVSVSGDLQMNFSEPVALGTAGYVSLYRAGSDLLVERFNVATGQGNLGGRLWTSGSSVVFNPVNPLSAGTDYYVKVDDGAVVDLSGNAFAGINDTTTWNFTAGANADTTAPNLRVAFLENFAPADNANDAQSTQYSNGITVASNYTDLSVLFGSMTANDVQTYNPYGSSPFNAGDVRSSTATDSQSTNTSVNWQSEANFKLVFSFDEAIRPYGQIIIRVGGQVVESFDLATGTGSLGGGIKPTTFSETQADVYTTSAGVSTTDNRSFTIDPGFTFAPGTSYSVELVGVKDGAGNLLDPNDTNFSFTTRTGDTLAPQIVNWNLGTAATAFTSASGTNGLTGVGVEQDIVFKASESLIPGASGSVSIRLYNNFAGAAVETFSWSSAPTATDGVYTLTGSLGGSLTISGQTVRINPGQNLEYGTAYSVSASGLTDPAGNAFTLNTNTGHYFTTLAQTTGVQTVAGNAVTHITTTGLDDDIVVRFGESVVAGSSTPGSQSVSLYNRSGTLIETFDVATGQGNHGGTVSFAGTAMTVHAGEGLEYATGYYLTVTSQAIRAANENVTEDVGNVDGNATSGRFYNATNMGNANTPLYFATEAGTQIDPGWIQTQSMNADGTLVDSAYASGGWNMYYAPLPGQAAASNSGLRPGEWTGMEVSAAGDVDGDGIMDYVIGSPMKVYDPTLNPSDGGDNYVYGKYYLVFGEAGSTRMTLNIDELAAAGRVVEFYGPSSNWLKGVHEFGDLNHDGYDDLLLTSGGTYPDTDLTNSDKLASNDGDLDAGATFVVYGQARNEWVSSLNVTQLGRQGLEITGGLPQEQLGFSATAGDFNGDGTVDLLLGMPRNDRDGFASGEGFVINGGDFSNSLMRVGTDQADTLLGDFGADRLAGQQGNDQIFGLGGADILRGGLGNDTIGLTDLDFILLDGGTGTDTLRFVGHGFNLDLTGYAGASLRSFENIDLTGDGNNSLTLNYREAVYLLERELSTAYGTQTQLTVDGNVGDQVTLEGPWSLINSDNTYNYYALDGIFVAVDADITQNTPTWTIPYNGATIDFYASALPDGLRVDQVDFSVTGNLQTSTSYVEALGDVNNDGFADFAVADNDVVLTNLPLVDRQGGQWDNYYYDDANPSVPYIAGQTLYTSSAGHYYSTNTTNYVGATGAVYIV